MKALITGASKGIGRAIARELALMGYDLVLIARPSSDFSSLQNELVAHKIDVKAIEADLSDDVAYNKLDSLIENVDVLINNVGHYTGDNILSLKKKELIEAMNNNLFPAVYFAQKTAPYMQQKNKGVIVNIGSVLSVKPRIDAASYTIAKFALRGFNEVLRETLRDNGIKVIGIFPGSVYTSAWPKNMNESHRLIQPEDIAKAVKFVLETGASALPSEIYINPTERGW